MRHPNRLLAAPEASSYSFAKNLAGRVATAASALLLWAGTAEAQTPATQPETPAPLSAPSVDSSCAFNLLGGQNTPCDVTISPPRNPSTCGINPGEKQFQHFKNMPRRMHWAERLVSRQGISSFDQAAPHHLDIGFQEQAGTVDRQQNRASADFYLGKLLGANTYRNTIMLNDYRRNSYGHFIHPAEVQQNDQAINQAFACGLHVELTLAGAGHTWTVPENNRAVLSVADRYDGLVDDYDFWNEPNQPGWALPMPGKSVYLTNYILYQEAYSAVKGKYPEYTFNFSSLSSAHDPMGYLKKVAAQEKPCDTPGEIECGPIKTSKFTYHTYTNFRKGLAKEETTVHKLFAAGKLETPDGEEPQTEDNEFGASYKNDRHRAKRLVKIIKWLCDDPHIVRFVYYGLDVPSLKWQGRDVTFLADRHGRLSYSFYALSSAVRDNQLCIKQPVSKP